MLDFFQGSSGMKMMRHQKRKLANSGFLLLSSEACKDGVANSGFKSSQQVFLVLLRFH
jgi:hypothetical protein